MVPIDIFRKIKKNWCGNGRSDTLPESVVLWKLGRSQEYGIRCMRRPSQTFVVEDNCSHTFRFQNLGTMTQQLLTIDIIDTDISACIQLVNSLQILRFFHLS